MKSNYLMSITLFALIILFSLLASGCAEFSAVRSGVASHGANAADQALSTAEWGVCKGVTMGAWQRRYGNNPRKTMGWRDLCSESATLP